MSGNYSPSIPRGNEQLKLSEEVAITEIAQILADSDALEIAVRAIHAGFDRKQQRMQPIKTQHSEGGPGPFSRHITK
jgi:hypothetical protein